jgi:hypothetical protein
VRLLCSAITLLNLVVFTFLLVDDDVSQTCADSAHFYVRQPFCVFQAFITVGVLDFVIMTALGIAIQLWASLILKVCWNRMLLGERPADERLSDERDRD